MRDRARRLFDLVLAVNAVGFGAIGLVALVTPHRFAALADIELTTAAARADYSGVYGGLHLAFAAVMVGTLVGGQTRDGLFVALCAFTGLAFARAWGMAATASADALMIGLLAFEIVAIVVLAWAWSVADGQGWRRRISRPTFRSRVEA